MTIAVDRDVKDHCKQIKQLNQTVVIVVLNSTWFLDDLLNIDIPYFEGMVNPPGPRITIIPYVKGSDAV